MSTKVVEFEFTQRQYIPVPEAARFLGVCRAMVYKLMGDGKIPSAKFGNARRIPVAALKAYADRHTVGASN